MKFKIQSRSLQQHLQAVSKVINTKNALSILDNFLFEVIGQTLRVTGTDQENTVTVTMDVMEADHDGEVAINAKMLIDRLKLLPDQGLTLEINDDTYEIKLYYQNGVMDIMGVDANEYPRSLAIEEEPQVISVPGGKIQAGIDNTLFAVSTDTLRPLMMGIYWDIHHDDITFVSSDTHKLVRCIAADVHPGIERSFVVPAKPSAILRDVIDDPEEEIKVAITSKNATFSKEGFSLTCRFINGNYPDYNRVIPRDTPFAINVNRADLLSAARRVSLSASQASSLIKIDVQPDKLILTAQDLDFSISGHEEVACDYQGNPMVIGFKSQYFIELLSNPDDENIVIRLTDPARPALFEPEKQPEECNVLMLLMPMQTME